jgi:hypothetical protein
MDDETAELKRLQLKAQELLQGAIFTARHRPDMASVSAGWAHDASLELMRFSKGTSTPTPPQLTIPTEPATPAAEAGAS